MSDNIAKRLGLAQRTVVRHTSVLTDSTRNIGVEVEVEDVNRMDLSVEQDGIWEVVRDGSLRPPDYSAELRSPTPGYAGKDLIKSLESLDKSKLLAKASFSWRCAVHVHVDMRDKTPEEIQLVMVLYSLVEPFFFAWDGTGRQESRFCMPWWVCSQDMMAAAAIADADSNNSFVNAIAAFSKYTALNLAPLKRLGTIEFRHMKSTRDKDRLTTYINMCLDVVKVSEKVGTITPIQLVLQYMTIGPQQFIQRWFSNGSANALLGTTMGELPLTQPILDRVVNTAITLAELHSKSKLAAPANSSTRVLSAITRGE